MVKNAAQPLAQTDKIVTYGDGNATRVVKDVMTSTSQVVDGIKQATGIDLAEIVSGIARKASVETATPDAPKE